MNIVPMRSGIEAATSDEGRVIDPVCGMTVDRQTAKHRAEHAGHSYYFCSSGCRTKFVAEPANYMKPDVATKPGAVKKPPAVTVPEGTIYTCPMHSQIRQVGPGNCPICGMTLEPELVTADAAPNAELADMSRRFWWGLALALPVFLLEMGGHITGLTHWLGQQTSN